MSELVYASALRNGDVMLPERAGWYRWYAATGKIKKLLTSEKLSGFIDSSCRDVDFYESLFVANKKDFAETKKDEKKYYGIYVGQAGKSLQERVVAGHINGYDDTPLRKAIRCLYSYGVADEDDDDYEERVEEDVDDFIDGLVVEYETVTVNLNVKEKREINRYITPLNIKDNDRREDCPILDLFLDILSDLHTEDD